MTNITSVLLDRDGTLIADKHYLADPAGVELLPGAVRGLRLLRAEGVNLFVVTNQSGIGRGYFTEDAYRACHAAMENLLRSEGILLTDSAFCPHGPEQGCACRKPALGMWRGLAATHGLRCETTAMVGDKMDDVLFGRSAGFATVVLVLTGKGAAEAAKRNLPVPDESEPYRVVPQAAAPGGENLPHAVAADLYGAALFILAQRGAVSP